MEERSALNGAGSCQHYAQPAQILCAKAKPNKSLLTCPRRAKVFHVKQTMSLNEYITAAVATARFEKIDAGQTIYAEIPQFKGVWAQGSTRQEVVKELRQVLRGWIELQLERGNEVPSINGAKLEEFTFA